MFSKSRLKAKTITWGTLVLLITSTIIFAILRNWTLTIAIGSLSALQEAIFYYFHANQVETSS